jgi:lysophospholipase
MTETEGTVADGRLFYRHWDAGGAGRQVVLVHGFAEHSGRYGHVAGRLNEAGFNVWALDQRGHGKSLGERANIESVGAAVSDLDLFVDLVGGGPVFMIGHSMGGLVATAYAEEHQDRLAGLILSGPLLSAPPELLALADLPEVPDLGLADAVSSDPAVVQAYKDDPLVYLGPPPRGFLKAAGQLFEVRDRLGSLSVPLLIMHGGADVLVSPQALRDVVASVSSDDLTARIWPGLWHEIFNEPQKDAVLDFLVAWLRGRA